MEPKSIVYNMDCNEFMRDIPDKYFSLAIIDPNYGIGEDGQSNHSRSKLAKSKLYIPKEWDKEPVSKTTLDEIIRVSKNQIIWGANHFISKIPYDSPAWIVWDKRNGGNDFADCELAWTSFNSAVRIFRFRWAGMLQENMKYKEIRIHPTQKPVPLYKWILQGYASPGDVIFDSHMGSQNSRKACYDGGFDYYGCEIDTDYFNDGCESFEAFKAQLTLNFSSIEK